DLLDAAADRALGAEGESALRIGRARHGPARGRRDHRDVHAEIGHLLADTRDGAHDAIDLRTPALTRAEPVHAGNPAAPCPGSRAGPRRLAARPEARVATIVRAPAGGRVASNMGESDYQRAGAGASRIVSGPIPCALTRLSRNWLAHAPQL